MLWKYAANLKENSHIELWFQKSCKEILRTLFPKNTYATSVLKSLVETSNGESFSLNVFAKILFGNFFRTLSNI